MCHCGVIFCLPAKAHFKWTEGYDDISDIEMKTLIIECNYALNSLQHELSSRLGSTKAGPKVENCYEILKTNAKRVQDSGLNFNDLSQLADEAQTQASGQQPANPSIGALKQGLTNLQPKSRDGWKQEVYAEFLWLVSRLVSPAHALLVKCSIGKNRVRDLDLGGRAKLARYVKQSQDLLFCHAFQNKAIELGLNHDDIDSNSQLGVDSKKRKNDDVTADSGLGVRRSKVLSANTNPNVGFQSLSSPPRPSTNTECSVNLPSSISNDSTPSVSSCERHNSIDNASITRNSQALVIPNDTQNSSSSTRQMDILDVLDSNQPDRLSDTDYLALLFYPLGDSEIPHVLFERARSPQPRWTECGLQGQVTALEAGLDQRLVNLLSDETRLIQTIRKLDPLSKLSTSTNGPWSCSVANSSKTNLCRSVTEHARGEWSLKILNWICFVFPRDRFWEPRFVTVVKLLLPLLDIVLQHFIQRGLPACMKTETVEVLLAASTIGDRQSQLKVVAMAATFLGDDPPEYLQAALAHKQSILSRLEADFDRSELFIKDFCRRTRGLDPSGPVIQNFYQHLRPNLVDKRLNALCGRLHVSHLENLVQRDQYSTAVDEIDDWTTTENPSLMECRELPRKAVVVAKIFRSQGNFAEVRTTLERCFETLRPQDSNRFQVITGLADVYCDLGLAEKAFAKVAPEIEIEENKGSRGKSYRRLLVSAIDADLGQRLYENAERAIQKVESIFSDLSNLDVSDELLHVRALVASARICYYKLQFPEALRKWEVALVHVQKYKSFNGEGFTYAGIHLSICLAYLEIGNSTEGWNSFRRADIIFYRGMRDFWIPNFATRWLPDVQARIETLAGWKAHLQTKDG